MSSLSIKEYLHTSYENPDPEYKDGELVERSFADNAHSTAMGRVSNIFWDLRESRRGVRFMWLVVRPLQKLYAYSAGTVSEVPAFEIPEYDVRITAADIFG